MHCPKCSEVFEEGSRRFCPIDGARLVSDAPAQSEGIFQNLLSKMAPPPADKPAVTAAAADPSGDKGPFFELDEIDLFQITEPAAPVAPPPAVEAKKPEPPVAAIPPPANIANESARPPDFDFTSDEFSPDDLVGRVVKGRYQVSEFLGGDESGLAFLAEDRIVRDRKVLVRVLPGPPSNEILESLLAEERVALSHFSHPNIARLIDSGEFGDGTRFLVSEYFDALSAADVLSIHGRISPERTGRIIQQIADVLAKAHQQGVIHRDLRPANLIIDASGETEQARLVNFGAATGEPTPSSFPYKSPEVLQGRVSTVSSDIFSLAVVAYEMLTGEVPFKGANPKEVIRSQDSATALVPSEIVPAMSHTVDTVLKKGMAFSPADRFSTARELGDALSAALSERPAPALAAAEPLVPASEPVKVRPATPSVVRSAGAVDLKPVGTPPAPVETPVAQPAWKNRSPEPPAEESSRFKALIGFGIVVLAVVLGLGIYYLMNRPEQIDVPTSADRMGGIPAASPAANTDEMPPLPRTITQPPNTNFFQNSKQSIRGDLLVNFVGFSMYYPSGWKVNGAQQRADARSRGKFIDISRMTPDGRMQEQMLVSYYPSKGTYPADADKFAQLSKESVETLRGLLPGFQVVSEGETRINGDWRAYEVKFQAGRDDMKLWGRRLFIPAARPGTRNGFEITMLATSLAPEVKSADDVGVRGELAGILHTFEPSQNF